ncbi:hypothetical protein GOP47_0018955 [Adiantum capillus-veneris]|uniref:Sec-independent protein translocase protein TatB n=1 Tax=Adiantum capillus-veneris TaxID=13818 RepID=A0A9D4UFK3_ADICA|nr:hypothetical protein GOP47_0018955 [Adiantum capillus-veneris]
MNFSKGGREGEMVFGFSFGEVLLLMVGTVILLGPKDLPIVARAAGRLTGRAVGYIQTIRSQADTIMQQSQANSLQKELREAMAQLDAIRYEVRSGMSIMQPRPFVRENLENYGSGLQQATKLVHKIENTLDRFADATTSNVQTEGISKSSVDLQRQATSFARVAGHLHAIGTPEAVHLTDKKRIPIAKAFKENESGVSILPISAVSMGLFPARTGPIAGGSDLMLESLAERKVAQQAVEFLQQPTEPGNTLGEVNEPQKTT